MQLTLRPFHIVSASETYTSLLPGSIGYEREREMDVFIRQGEAAVERGVGDRGRGWLTVCLSRPSLHNLMGEMIGICWNIGGHRFLHQALISSVVRIYDRFWHKQMRKRAQIFFLFVPHKVVNDTELIFSYRRILNFHEMDQSDKSNLRRVE